MSFELDRMLRLPASAWYETAAARYYVPLPGAAPNAFLHTIFAPLSSHVSTAEGRDVPIDWLGFLHAQNGANLFFNSLYLYGIRMPGALIDRGNPFVHVPFPIEVFPEYIKIGSYGFDATQVILAVTSLKVFAVPRNSRNIQMEWADANTFLSQEISRIGCLFSDAGELLTTESATVPR